MTEPSNRLPHHIWFRCSIRGLAITLGQIGFACLVVMLAQRVNPLQAYSSLYQWDGVWYAHVAARGYRTNHPPAPSTDDKDACNVGFFPGYPLVIRALQTVLGVSVQTSVLLVSQLSCWGFWTYWFRFMDHWKASPRLIEGATITLLAHPAAFFLIAGYSESLFLLGVLGFFYWSKRHERWAWPLAALYGIAMTATRIVGLPLVGVPVLQSWDGPIPGRFIRVLTRMLLAITASLGGLLFFAYCQARFGAWNAYLMAQAAVGVKPDYLWIVNPDYWHLYFPTNHPPFLTGNWASRVTVPLMVCMFAGVATVEICCRRHSTGAEVRQRLGYYLCGAFLFYFGVAGMICHPDEPLQSVIRYSFCAYVVVVLGFVHLLCQVTVMTGRSAAIALGGLRLFNGASLLLQTWYVSVFANSHWVA
ncbi:MAG: hypothetical protein K2R98_05145 [Gemmataceae bacterium]|nr:hypothetical protein [Gemmataceae bacterium]